MASGGQRAGAGSGGRREGAGRPKGSQNKLSRDAKEIIWNVFERMGGEDALLEWAKENRSDFNLKLFNKLAPSAKGVTADINSNKIDDILLEFSEKRRLNN